MQNTFIGPGWGDWTCAAWWVLPGNSPICQRCLTWCPDCLTLTVSTLLYIPEVVVSYEEKGTWVYLAVSLLTYGVYLVMLFSRVDGALADVEYLPLLLWAVGISIVLSVVGRVAFEIAKPSERTRGDVRDKEINRRGEFVGGLVVSIGMVGPFALTLAEARHFWIANAMYAVFTVGAVVGASIKLVAYRRGF